MDEFQQRSIFEEWLQLYKGVFFKVVRAYAFNPMDRDDLFQEIVIQVWHSVPSFKNESAVTTWLYRIAFNTAVKWLQKERRSRQFRNPLGDTEPLLQETSAGDDRLEWLYESIATFDIVDRSVILLMLDGFSYKEMSLIVGITESNLGVKINRIKKKLIVSVKKS